MLLALGPCENVFFYEIAKMRFENIKILPKKMYALYVFDGNAFFGSK